jgi:exonuclease SbcC
MEAAAMIRHVELHNFASHEDTQLDFVNGKNVIIGATGSGKSNILQAIDFAFMGDKISNVNLPELIADGSETAEVIVEYDDPRTGQAYVIHRTLTRDKTSEKADHECSITNLGTNEVVKRPDPVRKTLESFGVDSSVWRYIVHVAQGRFGDLLEETQDRKSSLDKLFEVSQLESTYQELGRQEAPITQIKQRKQANESENKRFGEIAKKLEQERTNLEQLSEERKKKDEDKANLQAEHDRLKAVAEKNSKTLERLSLVEDSIRTAQASAENARNQINTLVEHLEVFLPASTRKKLMTIPSPEIRELLDTLGKDLLTAAGEEKRRDSEHSASVTKASGIQANLDSSNENLQNIQQELEAVKDYLAGKGEQPKIVCDRCGSILSNSQWQKHLQEQQESITKLGEQAGDFRKSLEIAKAKVKERRKLWDEARSNVKSLEHAIPIVKQIEDQRCIIEQSQDQEPVKARTELLVELRTLLATSNSKSDDEVITQALSLPNEIGQLLSRIRELSDELKSFDEKVLNPQIARVKEAEEAQSQVLLLEPAIDLDAKKLAMLELIRRSLRDVQPVVRRRFVAETSKSANDYMQRLYAGAELENFELTEDYQFIVTRAGYKRHARRLSGGQQVLASMAFLMALSEVLSQLDFLILDEPTTHLDENRRKELVNVLENLRRVPQLIIVDHHQELLAAADARFQVTLNGEGQSQVTQTSE